MPTILGLLQSKGGVGKTTTAVNLGAELTRRGASVAIVDADPAGHAAAIAKDGRLPYPVVADLLEDESDVAAWARRVRAIKADYVIIDAPGSMGLAFGATVAVADIVLIPSGATVLDMRGAAETVGIVRRHRKSAAKGKPEILLVPSRIDKRTATGREVVAMLAGLTEPVAPAVSYRTIVADSLATGEPVPAESPSAAEFAALADAVLVRLGEKT